jgi:hypothetical protein
VLLYVVGWWRIVVVIIRVFFSFFSQRGTMLLIGSKNWKTLYFWRMQSRMHVCTTMHTDWKIQINPAELYMKRTGTHGTPRRVQRAGIEPN